MGEAGGMEVVGVLQLEPDTRDIARVDRSPAPGGERP
jgi:hypothetical protein